MTDFTGTIGNDSINGTTGTDDFFMDQGGNDRVNGGGAGDVFWFGGALNAKDRINGGDGADTLVIEGAYAPQVFLNDSTIRNIENINLLGAHSYGFYFADGNVGANQIMTVVCGLEAGFSATIDFVQETDGNYIVFGSEGDDRVYGGAGDDVVYGGFGADTLSAGAGTDTVNGGAGLDIIEFFGTGALDSSDRVDGGENGATLRLWGDYSAGYTLGADVLLNINVITLVDDYDYTLDFGAFVTGPTSGLTIDGSGLASGDRMDISLKGAQALQFVVRGGLSNDTIVGSNNTDIIAGGRGADTMEGRGNGDEFFWDAANESSGAKYDTIVRFDAQQDFLRTPGVETGVDDAVTEGQLRADHFTSDIAAAIGAAELGANHAVLFKADTGSLADEWFLIVDFNGVAGCQPKKDLIVHLDDPLNIEQLDTGNFPDAS